MASFITPSELKSYALPVTAAQWQKVGDDQLAIVIGFASDHLEDYMDRTIAIGTYTARLRGAGLWRQMLPLFPIVTLNGVTAYNNVNSPTTYDVSDFYVDHEDGILEWLDKNRYKWSQGQTYVIEYTSGFSEVPGPIKHAAALQTVKMLQPLFRGGSNFTEVELITDIDEQVVELLEKYKRKRIG